MNYKGEITLQNGVYNFEAGKEFPVMAMVPINDEDWKTAVAQKQRTITQGEVGNLQNVITNFEGRFALVKFNEVNFLVYCKLDKLAYVTLVEPEMPEAEAEEEIEEKSTERPPLPVTQSWTWELPLMQQTVLLSAVRGHDGMAKKHAAKHLVRWLRRCCLLSAFDGKAYSDFRSPGGGGFCGPLPADVTPDEMVDSFLEARDEMSYHYWSHFKHAAEILGTKYPLIAVRNGWKEVFERMVHCGHDLPETEDMMNDRLGDTEAGWKARNRD